MIGGREREREGEGRLRGRKYNTGEGEVCKRASGALEQKIRPSSRDLLHPLAHRLTYNLPAKHGFNLALSRYRTALSDRLCRHPLAILSIPPRNVAKSACICHPSFESSDFSIKLMFEMSKMKRTINSSFHLIDQKFLCSIYVQSRSFFPQRDGNLRTQGRARLLRAPPYWPFLPARATSCSSKFAPPIISTVFSRKGNRCSRISSGWKFIESLLL